MPRAATAPAAAPKTKLRLVGTIGSMTDQLVELRDRKRELEKQVAAIDAEVETISETLLGRLEAEGTDKGAGSKGSVSVTRTTVANVLDWEAFNAWVLKTKNVHLFQRRISDPAWREIFEKKGAIPGTQPFHKKRLNVRTTTSTD